MIRYVALNSDSGSVILLDSDSQDLGYISPIDIQSGLAGFGLLPRKTRIEDSVGAGGVFRHSRQGVREIVLPLHIRGDLQHGDMALADRVRLLGRILADSPRLSVVWVPHLGDAPRDFVLDVVHVGGGDPQFGEDVTSEFCNWVIQLQAPQPFWTDLRVRTISSKSGEPRTGFIQNLTKLRVNSSQIFGTVEIDTESDVATPPVWEIKGPMTDLTISDGVSSFKFDKPISAGETITVNVAERTVKDSLGENAYPLLGQAPKFFKLKPGRSTYSVLASEVSEESLVTCSWNPKIEVLI